ncbi:hypothetical protein ACWDKQ_35525, partial [Saccharopolyspora sp. NPDC000995]
MSELIANANAGLEGMREQGLPVDELLVKVQSSMGAFGGHDGLRNVMAHHILSHPGDDAGTLAWDRKLRELAARDWDQRYARAAAELEEWAGFVGRDAVDRLLADADVVLGPLKASERFRNVLAHWMGEHPSDWSGVQAVRAEMAGYLADDIGDLGEAVSGLPRGAFEETRAEEAHWQADRAGNQAEVGAVAVPTVRGDRDPGLRIISQIRSVRQTFEEAGQALRQLANEQGPAAVDRLYAPAEKVLGSLKESPSFRDVMAHELLKNPRDDQQLRQLMTNPQGDPRLQQLRWKLVRYLTGDTSGGADPITTHRLLSATVDPAPGADEARSKEQQMYYRRVAVGKALSGLPDNDAVERVLGNEDSEVEVRRKLTSDLQNLVGSLRQILAEEKNAALRDKYEPKIAEWLPVENYTQLNTIRHRVAEATAAVQSLRKERKEKKTQKRDSRVARLRGALEELQARQAELEPLKGWQWILRADWNELSETDAGLRKEWEALPGRIEAVQAELAEIADGDSTLEPPRKRMRVSWERQATAPSAGGSSSRAASAAVVKPPAVVELAGLIGRMARNLAALPTDFRPDVQNRVTEAWQITKKKSWTPAELGWIDSQLEEMRQLEQWSRVEPMMFLAGDSGAVEQVLRLARGLRGVQVVGVHVTPDGWAVLPDGLWETPEEFAARVRADQRFVAGLPVAFLGCGASRRPVEGVASFADRFADAVGAEKIWGTDADVWQTADAAIHATETVVTSDGRVLPKFVDGEGTGRWFLRSRDGEVVEHGSELRAGVNRSAVPRYAEGAHPAPVIKWTGTPGPSQTNTSAARKAARAAGRAELNKRLTALEASVEEVADRLGTEGSGVAARAGAGREDQAAGWSGESPAAAELLTEPPRKRMRVSPATQATASSAGGSSSRVASAAAVKPDVVVELAGLVGHLEERLAALPADFRPDVRAQV